VADPLIRVSNLYKVFGSDPKSIMAMVREGRPKDEIRSETGHALALKGVDLEIETSEIFVIMGLSGSGKSTLIRHLNRLIEPTEGSIHVGGVDLMSLSQTKLETFRQHRISMVFQRYALLPHRTALQNVAFGLAVQKQLKKDREKKAREWLEAVGLDGYEECYPAELSGGEQQRVGLARALCTDPDILLMDEAFSSLDPLIRSEMQGQLIDLQSRLKKTIVFITHDLNEAIRLGDRIAILKEGEISQVGKPQDILDNPADDYVAAFVRDVKRSRSPKARR
jgi:glycine betaine/proline transport system ATP-binding protein